MVTAQCGLQDFNLTIKGRDYFIETFKCYHTVPTIGYGISEIRQKLASQYTSLSQTDLITLKRAGTKITQDTYYPILAYLCDTTAEVFSDSDVFKFPTIMVEVTMLLPEHTDHALENKHICWHQIKDVVASHPDTLFILIHFSMRYTWEEIDNFFQKVRDDEKITNFLVWKN